LYPGFHRIPIASEGGVCHFPNGFDEFTLNVVRSQVVLSLDVFDFQDTASGVEMEPKIGVGRHPVVRGNTQTGNRTAMGSSFPQTSH
jgi:hypothetical protein